jgi:ribose 1,5-bisphosphokinase PhnN
LLCFLHGPGGCGKSTVIDLVIEYAREYCGYFSNYEFTKRTIVVTAMTGVAATILLGETTHSALYLNQKKILTVNKLSFGRKPNY